LKARVRSDAPARFLMKHQKTFGNNPLPANYQKLYILLGSLAGQVFEVSKTYLEEKGVETTRVHIDYPEPRMFDGKPTAGLDLDRELVDFL